MPGTFFAILKATLWLYLAYAVVGGVFSYAIPRSVGQKSAARLSKTRFRAGGRGNGPDRVLLAETPGQAFARRIELINAAHNTLDISIYTIKPGVTTRLLGAAILKAADRGVQVRLLLSGKTNKLARHKQLFAAVRGHENIKARVFNPLRPHTPWRWNTLMHDKIILVDEHTLSLGGRNIGDEYFAPPGYTGRVTHDRELLVCNTGQSDNGEESALPAVVAYFEALWSHRLTHALRKTRGAKHTANAAAAKAQLYDIYDTFHRQHPGYFAPPQPFAQAALPSQKVTLLHNPLTGFKKQPWIGWQLHRLCAGASFVLVQTPYLTNQPGLLRALRHTCKIARMEVVTNSTLSSPNLPAFSVYLSARKKFLATGASFWEYQSAGSSIHAKSLLVDGDLAAVGSFNLDDRSIFIDTETMLVVHGRQFNRHLTRKIGALRAQSALVGQNGGYVLSGVATQPPLRAKHAMMRLAGPVFRLFRFLV